MIIGMLWPIHRNLEPPKKQALSGFKRSNPMYPALRAYEQLFANLDIGIKSCPIVVSLFHYWRLAQSESRSRRERHRNHLIAQCIRRNPVPRVPDFILATIPNGIYAEKGIYLTFNSAVPRKRSHWAASVYPVGVREQLAEQSLHQYLYLLRAP